MSDFWIRSLAWSVVPIVIGVAATQGEEPKDKRKTAEQVVAETGEDKIKPLPLTPIPDDPPPHEGAMIDLPYVVEPPDLLYVSVLEALPGRPIDGERLVRPDGKISLNFYGEVHVAGLSLPQVKEKIVKHLRHYLSDETLGLLEYSSEGDGKKTPLEPLQGEGPPPANEAKPGKPSASTEHPQTKPPNTISSHSPSLRASSRPVASSRTVRRTSDPRQPLRAPKPEAEKTKPEEPVPPPPPAPPPAVRIPATSNIKITIEIQGTPNPHAEAAQPGPPAEVAAEQKPDHPIHPTMTDRVFVDASAYNSKVYYVLGDVAQPGKLPWTGRETVLDAVNCYAGGLIPTADPKDIKLVRPARAGKPTKIYPIDLEAILQKGDTRANYQLFPGDRIMVGRNKVDKVAIEIDREARTIQTVINSLSSYASMIQNLTLAAAPAGTNTGPALTPAQREAILNDWLDLWWKAAGSSQGAILDEKTFKEMLLRHLNPPATSTSPAAKEEK
jgi:protein involved in polysaccharide export with SLBB domain